MQQQKSDQAVAQEQNINFTCAQKFGGAMGYDRGRQYTGEDENALDQLSHFSQESRNQG